MAVMAYNGKRIQPCPQLSIHKQIQATSNEKIGNLFTITLNGQLVAYKGSPQSNGSFWQSLSTDPPDEDIDYPGRLGSLVRKQQALRQLFATDGAQLYYQSDDFNSSPVTFNPRVVSIDFQEGNWVNETFYSIQLEADDVFNAANPDETYINYIDSAEESWSVSEFEVPTTYQASHTLSARGKRHFDSGQTPAQSSGAWQYAQAYVLSNLGYNPLFIQNSPIGSGVNGFNDLLPYNYVRLENIDKHNGSYSITETWILATGIAVENYTVKSQIEDQSVKTISVQIDGTIIGLYSGLNNYVMGFTNAQSYWNDLRINTLVNRASSYASGTTLNFLNGSVNNEPNRGQLAYSYIYDNRPITGTGINDYALDEFTISSKNSYEDYRTQVTIQGTIQGILLVNDIDPTSRYSRADNRWQAIKTGLYARAQTYASNVLNLQSSPIEQDVGYQPQEGIITYSYVFDNRTPSTAFDSYSVTRSYNRDQGYYLLSIAGQVQGYDLSGSGIVLERYNNALSAAPSDTTIYNRVVQYGSGVGLLNIPNVPLSKESVFAPQQGNISYNYSYSTQNSPLFSGAISEVVSVSDINQSDIFAAIPVPGRLQGPVLQRLFTYTEMRRQVSIELVMAQQAFSTWPAGYNLKPNTNSIISGLVPTATQVFKSQDSENWDFKNNRYSRNIEWCYGD